MTGKGILKTYWLTPYVDRAYNANGNGSDEETDVLMVDFSGKLANHLLKREREIEWVSELIRDAIRQIVAQRATRKGKMSSSKSNDPLPHHRSKRRVPLDEVVDIIKMPHFDSKSAEAEVFAVKIPENVSRLIREYVSIVRVPLYTLNWLLLFDGISHFIDFALCIRFLLLIERTRSITLSMLVT